MKLLKCEIQNFGKIRKGTYEFKDGCNSFCERNGWGKSTLAAFIKIMFYGFENERTRSEYENERRRFRPWQGGVYGGKLVFESDGETYEIERVFGSKEKEDKFCVRNLRTNLEETKFLPNVGESLFKIDRESFDRTVFISQSECATSSTDSINAKLGNLVENTNDINNYDSANQMLVDIINKLSPDKKNGSLNVMANRIAEIKNTLADKAELEEAINVNVATMKEKSEQFEALKAQQKQLQDTQELSARYVDVKAKQDKYNELNNEAIYRKEAFDKVASYFPGELPTEEEIGDILLDSARLTSLNQSVMNYSLSDDDMRELNDWENKFVDTPPAPEEVDDIIKETATYFRMTQEYSKSQAQGADNSRIADYEARFNHIIPKEEEIASHIISWNERTSKVTAIPVKEANIDKIRAASAKKAISPMVYIGCMLAVAGIVLAILKGALGVLFIALGAIIGVVGYFTTKSNTSHVNPETDAIVDEIRKDREYIAKVDNKIRDFLNQYGLVFDEERVIEFLFGLKSDLKEYQDLRSKSQESGAGDEIRQKLEESSIKIDSFIKKYFSHAQQGANYIELIHDLQYGVETYRHLYAKKQELDAVTAERDEVMDRIRNFYERLGITIKTDINTQLIDMKSNLQTYTTCYEEWQKADAELQKFLAKEDTASFIDIILPETIAPAEETNAKLAEVTALIDESHKYLDEVNKVLNDLYLKKEEFDEAEESLKELTEQYEKDKKKYELISKARELLEQSRANIIGKYIGPIKDGFAKYYKILTQESADKYHIDANTHLTVEEEGLQREICFFSSGYQDMIGVCMRMSLVEAMYKEEKPFIIFDDPFINLDMDKTEGALQFLEEVSKEFQIIYFTCNDSRIRK